MGKQRLLFCWLVLALLLTGTAQAEQLKVVTTFSILEDLARQVGGERVLVSALIPRGADPHSWEPAPKEARLVATADLLVANGGGFDQWLVDLAKAASRADTPLLLVSEGLPILQGEADGHGGDPHFWLSVPNAIYYAEQIGAALSSVSPQNAAYFEQRLAQYVEELSKLDQSMLELLGKIPPEKRVIITYHNAFSYLAERYGFEVVEFLVENPEAEPASREIGRLVNLLREQENPVVFSEPQISVSDRYVRTLASEAQARVYTLYSDSLSEELPTYLEMMQYNARTLLEALQ